MLSRPDRHVKNVRIQAVPEQEISRIFIQFKTSLTSFDFLIQSVQAHIFILITLF